MEPSFLRHIENKTGIDFDEILALAQAIQHADFTNERQVRKITRKVGRLANKPVSKELEDKIVNSILQDGKNLSFEKIEKML